MEFHSHVHLLHILISFSVDGTLIRMPVSVFLRSGQAADRRASVYIGITSDDRAKKKHGFSWSKNRADKEIFSCRIEWYIRHFFTTHEYRFGLWEPAKTEEKRFPRKKRYKIDVPARNSTRLRVSVCVLWELISWELSWELPLKMGSKWGVLVLFSEIF